MKILKAKFKNFIGFKDGMQLDELNLDFSKGKNRIILIKGNNGTGKAQPNSTVIYTPTGITTIGDLQKGSYVFDENFLPTEVLQVFPLGKLRCSKVRFSDDTETICNDDHLFTGKFSSSLLLEYSNIEEKEETLPLHEISLRLQQYEDDKHPRLFYVPIVQPKNFEDAPPATDFNVQLTTYGVKQRLELLLDLVKKYSVEAYTAYNEFRIHNLDPSFNRVIKLLISSLGGTYINLEKSSSLLFYIPKDILSLVYTANNNVFPMLRFISKITRTEEIVDMSCIKVANSKGLYLTNDFIVTHNTTLLSALQPFPGTFDERNSPILPGSDGLKVLDISHQGRTYKSQIQYLQNKTKCFLSEDDVELNSNGNVRSYLELLESKLGLTEEYFKIARIGRNVSNFIDLARTERKKYINNFIPNMDEYLEAGKIVNKKFTKLDNEISYIKKDIKDYDIEPMQELLKLKNLALAEKKKEYEKQLEIKVKLTERKEEQMRLLKLLPEDVESTLGSLTVKNKKLQRSIDDILDSSPAYREKLSVSYEDLLKLQKKVNIKHITLLNRMKTLKAEYDKTDKELAEYSKSLTEKETALGNFKSKNIKELTEFVAGTKTEISSIEEDINIMQEEFSYLKNLDSSFDITNYDFHQAIFPNVKIFAEFIDNVKLQYAGDLKVFKYLIESTENYKIIKKQLLENINKLNVYTETFNKEKAEFLVLAENSRNLKLKPKACKIDDCYFIKGLKTEDELQELSNKFEEKERALEKRKRLANKAWETFSNDILPLVEFSNTFYAKTFATSIPLSIFLIGSKQTPSYTTYLEVVNLALHNDTYLETDTLKQYISLKGELVKAKQNFKEAAAELENLETNKKLLKMLHKNLDDLRNKIDLATANKNELHGEIYSVDVAITKVETGLSFISRILEALDQIKINNVDIAEFSKMFEEIKERKAKISEIVQSMQTPKYLIDTLQREILALEKEIKVLDINLAHYIDFKNKLKKLEEVYDQTKLVKDSLDIKIGIPLVFSKSFLEIIESRTNELLDIAFQGKFKLNFVISEKEFSIRVIKDDSALDLDDIKKASQGQEILAKLSLSLSIILQAIKDYNIIYLDEVDGELDSNNRKVFFDLLESQLDLLEAEQCFIISHNEIYDAATCDLILFKGAEDGRGKENLQNVIYRHRDS
jgi:hypothetical protein